MSPEILKRSKCLLSPAKIRSVLEGVKDSLCDGFLGENQESIVCALVLCCVM